MSDLGGVWRTVGGRRIFIKDGEDLATAMKNSGKFGSKKEEIKEIKEYKEEKDFKNENENLLYENQIDKLNDTANEAAIKEYTGYTGIGSYENINKYLNDKIQLSDYQKNIVEKNIKLIDESIKQETKNEFYTYRGIAINENEISVGDEIINKGFTSTSVSKEIAQDFANNYNGSLIQVEVPKGTKALYIGSHSGSGFNEEELLFGRNSKIIIIKKNEKGIFGRLVYE